MASSKNRTERSLDQAATHIKNLESITSTVDLGGEIMRMLYNPGTKHLCQVFELLNVTNGRQSYVPDHIHVDSDELFYVLEGTLTFSDGKVVRKGEIRLIEHGVTHGGNLSPDGKAIIIVHPPESDYQIG